MQQKNIVWRIAFDIREWYDKVSHKRRKQNGRRTAPDAGDRFFFMFKIGWDRVCSPTKQFPGCFPTLKYTGNITGGVKYVGCLSYHKT